MTENEELGKGRGGVVSPPDIHPLVIILCQIVIVVYCLKVFLNFKLTMVMELVYFELFVIF